jgi:DNA-binding transcriptional regulator YdaS (Cro superfamily)
MRRLLLAAMVLGGLTALTASGALAAPSAAGLHVTPQPLITDVDWHHHHWHHRHWEHHHWRYW